MEIASKEKIYSPPMSERDKARRDPANAKKLWSVEIIFFNPENDNELKKYDLKNLLWIELKELRSSIFAEGFLLPIGDRADLRYCIVPPSEIRTIYVNKQKNFIE
jgi:hypothetical protein